MSEPLPTEPTSSRSRSRWRFIATLATAAVIAGSFLTFAAGPAAAVGEQSTIAEARASAQIALLRPACRQLLSNAGNFLPPGSNEADQVLQSADIVFSPTVPADQPEEAAASAPFGGGAFSTITVYPGFFDEDAFFPISGDAAFAPTLEQRQTILILHEVGHLTAREPDHNRNTAGQFDYNTDILNTCLAGPPPFSRLRITSFTCGPLPRGTGYVLCEAFWAGGLDPATARWFTPRAQRQPVVTTDPISKITTAAFDCNNPGGTEFTYTTELTITDAVGERASVATIPCGW